MPVEVPDKIRAYESLGFHYSSSKVSMNQVHGDCLFCGGQDKLYINTETGLWDCKSGKCALSGNFNKFLELWYEEVAIVPSQLEWQRLAVDRKLPFEELKKFGIRRYAGEWILPVYNSSNVMVNIRKYRYGSKLMGLPGVPMEIYRSALIKEKLTSTIFICEGEWDAIATTILLRQASIDGIAVGVPGAASFKDEWAFMFRSRSVIICYDADLDGKKGRENVKDKLQGIASNLRYVNWLDILPNGFDMRDFVSTGGVYSELESMFAYFPERSKPITRKSLTPEDSGKKVSVPVENEVSKAMQKALKSSSQKASEPELKPVEETKRKAEDFPSFCSGARPTYDSVLATFSKYLYMNEDLKLALKIIFAVIISNQIGGDPLWVHLASVPGSGKTELLRATETVDNVHFESTLTPHSLVSGWSMADGEDPSLIPKLHNKTFVLKDFTEILQMNLGSRDEIYGVLRGAYDGNVRKTFGNGLVRSYDSHFNLLTGVTPIIFAESGDSLGERFLIVHLVKGVGFDADRQIEAALGNVGSDGEMRAELQRVSKEFLEYRIDKEDVPEFTRDWTMRLVGLSQFVSMLRASVIKASGSSDRLAYRAQHEMGTRIAKQLKKLFLGLTFLTCPAALTDDMYKVIVRVAMDTCIGFNLDIVLELFKKDGLDVEELSERAKIPQSTIRECLINMEQLGVLTATKKESKEAGRPKMLYWLTETIERHWGNADLGSAFLRDEVAKAAKQQTETRRAMRIKREGSGESRRYVEES